MACAGAHGEDLGADDVEAGAGKEVDDIAGRPVAN